jgi:two-component system, sensor histidine kinase and response regulator
MYQTEMIAGSTTMEPSTTPHIHIIDDELSICTGIQGILETDGICASYSLTYQEGLQYLDKHHDVDVVLLDVNLRADITGIDVLPIIKTRHKYSQVIMFTSYDRLDVGLECMKRGAMDFMTKPFDEKHFLQLVSVAVEKKRIEQIKDLYFGMVIHDLKNPLQCISAAFEVLQEQLKPGLTPVQERLFATAESGVHQIQMMIGNILGITSFEKGSLTARRESFMIQSTINTVIELFANVEVISDDFFPVTIRSDRDLYTRILTNVVSNAVRFARAGSMVTVSCHYDDFERLLITSVTNEGSYIDEEQRKDVFNKFIGISRSMGTAQGQNYGLGLTFSKMAVEALDGTIWVESDKQSETTTFIFTIKDFSVV